MSRALLVILGLVGCGQSSGHLFGPLTDDGIDAFHSWCTGDFEQTSHYKTGIPAVDGDPNSRFVTCTKGARMRKSIEADSIG